MYAERHKFCLYLIDRIVGNRNESFFSLYTFAGSNVTTTNTTTTFTTTTTTTNTSSSSSSSSSSSKSSSSSSSSSNERRRRRGIGDVRGKGGGPLLDNRGEEGRCAC